MPRNTSGVYTLPAGNPVVPGTVIDAAWANGTMEDMANEITNSLSRTGAGGMLAPFRLFDGTVTAPGLSFLNETNTGLYRSGSGSAWMSVLGVNVAQFSTVGLTIPFGKALTAGGNASVAGTLAVTGATAIASTLAVTGAIAAAGGVIGNVTGNVTAASGTSTFNNITISGTLDMDAGSSATIINLPNPTNSGDAANKGYVDAQVATRLALTGGTMTGAIAMSNNKVTGLATPTADQDAATKAYVDSIAQGLDAKASCLAATTANITLSGTQTIDGVAVAAGARVLVKNQSSAAQNGIYVAAAGAWSRAPDADTWDELVAAYTFIEQGTDNGNNGYICTISAGGTLGTTPVTWAQFSGAGQVIAGAGLTKTGNTLAVGTASSSRIVVGADDIDLATTGVTASTYTSVTVDAYGRVTGGSNPNTLAGYGITNAYTTSQVDTLVNAKLSLTGGTMSGVIAMGGFKITGLADPTSAQDAATKSYIDTIFGSTTTAAASAAAAAASATSASNSATSASNSATAAAGSATSAASSYTTFNNQYLGSKSSDPTVNNTGGALVAGNLYWNSTASEMRVYNGSAWVAAYIPAAGYLALTGGTMTGVINFAAGQTIAGYLTTASAASTYQTIAGMSSYLTSATAASTYQTQAGMSSYLTTASAASTYLALTGGTLTGNLGFNGTALRITGDFSTNTTAANRVMFQSSTANGSTLMSAIPNGTGTTSRWIAFNSSDPANSTQLSIAATSTDMRIQATNNGTGTALPMTFYVGASENARISTGGNFLIGTTTDDAANKLQVTGGFALTGNYTEGVVTANTSTAYTIALTSATVQILTLTGNCTFTFPTVAAGKSFTLLLKQDATGSRTVTWPATVKWPGGTAPTITSTASKLDKYVFTSDGTNWYGSNAGQNYTV